MGRIWAFVRIMNVRLRFIFLMVLVGVVAANWERLQNYYDRWRRPAETPETVQAQEIEYYCPMHPNIIRGEPGNCPICGMPLAKRAKTGRTELAEGVLAQVQMSPQKVQMGRIATSLVQHQLLAREIRTVGIVEYDETRRAFIASRIKGRLDKLFVNYVGQQVKKGDPLVWIYSPDLLVAQDELLVAMRQMKEDRPGGQFDTAVGASVVEAARRKLFLWGITEAQIEEIIQRGKADSHLNILSPIEGIVTEKKVLEGGYVDEGTDLLTIADLSNVWMQAKVFEDQISGVRVGTAVEVTSVAYPNEIFAGKITFIAYTVDPATRTLAARVEISNPDVKLKPGMYATATIRLPAGRVVEAATSAPAEAGGPSTDGVARAYTALVELLAKDKTDAKVVSQVGHEAQSLVQQAEEPVKSLASELARLAKEMAGADLKGQRGILKSLSEKTIALLRARPPVDGTLFTVHCPMVDADWVQASEEVANPYYGSEMLRCGRVTGQVRHGAAQQSGDFAEGYFCPIYPDRLFDEPRECPIDKFPMKFVRVEKVLAVPASAVINTGTRTVVYRESAPGTYDMLEVHLGPKAGDFFPVESGVKAGDRVATAGAFILDAENRLNPAAGAQYFGASGGSSGGDKQHQHGG
ncbi:MAG: efflux RND transporter periplasmic adaptor subunit [Phycisphaerae bacterium]|nr:efflux RND transporter periplasmic adaptor subunit [Phycisphaerae bacterium]